MHDETDADLVRSVLARNDRASYGKLVERYQRRVYALCYSLVADWAEAQDLAQESFVRAWMDLAKLRDPARFGPWLRRVAFGTCRDWLRSFRPELYRWTAPGI